MKHLLKSILSMVLICTFTQGVEILAPISVGELQDKITILEIKMQQFREPEKLAHVHREWSKLSTILAENIPLTDELQQLKLRLFSINRTLWDIENDIRAKENSGEFDKKFIELSRSVYYTNDQRVDVKRAINEHTGSLVVDAKQYTRY